MGIEFTTIQGSINEGICIVERRTRDTRAVFALIIGIDDYKAKDDLPLLRGAVNDARAIQKYLLDDFHAPRSNIILLENDDATRANILSSISSHLGNNQNIPDDGEATILLFFAGHGSRTDAPANVIAPDGQIEVICPVDERTTNAAGEYVHAIPDYVLRQLLCGIARKKGSNIVRSLSTGGVSANVVPQTVILDCCHSGGMDRDVQGARTARSDSRSIPLDLDDELRRDRSGTVVPYRMWSKSTPYVVLAACCPDEKAREQKYEEGYHGRFTTNLLSLLRSGPIEGITYAELLDQIPKWPGQSPHCGGSRINDPIFSANYTTTGRRSALLTPQKPLTHGLFRVGMGTLEGIRLESEFLAYDPKKNVLCTLVARSVQADHAILARKDEHPVAIPRWSRAMVSDWNSPPVLVHVPADFSHAADLFRKTHATRSPKFVQTASLEDAHLVVRSDGDEIVVEQRTRMKLRVPPETRFALEGNPAHLPEVIDGIAHFNYFLGYHNENNPLRGFELEMHRLQGAYPARRPHSNENLVKGDEVELTSDASVEYGFTIRNNSYYDIFPHLFYFDLDNYTIHPWYLPASGHIVPPLSSGGTSTLGMGSDHAFEFTLLPGELSNSGFLKLFVTKEYVDLAWMQQELSPFDPRFEGTGRLRKSDEPLTFMSTIWDALTVTLAITALPDRANT